MARGYRFDVKWVPRMGSYAWGIQVFCLRNEAPSHFKPPPWTEHLNTSGVTSHCTDSFHVKPITPGHPIPKVFWRGSWKTELVETIHRQERKSSEKKSDGLHKKCSIELWTIFLLELLLCCYIYIIYICIYIYFIYVYICRYIYILREGGNFETFLKENYAVALESCCLFTKKCNW